MTILKRGHLRDPRSPLLRFGLGFVRMLYMTPLRGLLGRLYLLILHRGRRTGRVYGTLVTMLYRDRSTGEIFVTSSMQGERADWYRNLRFGPPIALQIGRSRIQVTHRFVDETERKDLYRMVCKHRPIRARLGLFVTGHKWPRNDDDYTALSRAMPAIAFTPKSE